MSAGCFEARFMSSICQEWPTGWSGWVSFFIHGDSKYFLIKHFYSFRLWWSTVKIQNFWQKSLKNHFNQNHLHQQLLVQETQPLDIDYITFKIISLNCFQLCYYNTYMLLNWVQALTLLTWLNMSCSLGNETPTWLIKWLLAFEINYWLRFIRISKLYSVNWITFGY